MSIENGSVNPKVNKQVAKEKNGVKMKLYKPYSARESFLLKALTKQKNVSQACCEELQVTNISLKKANEKLHNYKLANKGDFELAVESEVSRRLKEMCQPLGKGIQCNLNNVICMLESLTKMKTLLSSISKSTELTKESSKRNNSTTKTAGVQRRKHIVHPMVKGHVLQPFIINIPRVSMGGQQSCILNNTVSKRTIQPKALTCCTENSKNLRKSPETVISSDAAECSLTNSLRKKRRNNSYVSRNEPGSVPTSHRNSQCNSSAEENSYQENVTELASFVVPPRKEDPLEGPSWLYNGRRRKLGQNRQEVLARIKKGSKAPLEYFVYVDSSSDTEVEKKVHNIKTSNKKFKCGPKGKSLKNNGIHSAKNKKNTNLKHRSPNPSLAVSTNFRDKPETNGISDSETETNVTDQFAEQESIIYSPLTKLSLARNCSVVLKREQDDFGINTVITNYNELPSEKEIISPIIEPSVAYIDEFKLRGIAVVIEDIMKKHVSDVEKYLTNNKKVRIKKLCNVKISPSIKRAYNRKKSRTPIKPKKKKINRNISNVSNHISSQSVNILENHREKLCTFPIKNPCINNIPHIDNPCVNNIAPLVEYVKPIISPNNQVSVEVMETDPLLDVVCDSISPT